MSSRKRPEEPPERDAVSNKRPRFGLNQLIPGRATTRPNNSSIQPPRASRVDTQAEAMGPWATAGSPHHTEPDASGSSEQLGREQPYRGVAKETLTKKGTNLATQIISKAVDACRIGPIQDISNMLQDFADMHITEAKAMSEHQALQQRLQTLLKAVDESSDAAISEGIISKIENIRDFIKNELNTLATNQANNRLRLEMAKEDQERFLGCHHRVQQFMELLSDRMSSLIGHIPSSPSAWYDSSAGEELKRRECTSGTRIQVLANLLGWAGGDGAGGVYWLNGMAGTGKTTIAYSVCKELDAKRNLAGSFFCSRLREECRNVNNIIPSIAYQLAQFSLPFRSALSAVLEKDADIHTKRLPIQFRALIHEPLLAAKPPLVNSLVVVIDALDECENKDSTQSILDLLLNEAVDLPIKFLVSSRPEPQIRDKMTSGRARCRLVLHELDRGEVKGDVEKYLREGLAPMIPSDEQIAALVEKAGILFIYAATAVRYIGYDSFQSDPHGRLGDILDGPQSSEDAGNNDEIDQLYMTVLVAAVGNRSLRKVQRDDMRQVINTAISAREPLTVGGLSGLLGISDVERVRAALRPLWSVLHVVGANELVTTLHASFPDFMFDSTRSKTYWCDSHVRHRKLAEHCFERIAQTKPQFNICELESSYIADEKVPDIEKRAANAISSELLYACRYWADHIKAASCASILIKQIQAFLSMRLLLWMEVLNLTHQMKAGIECVKLIVEWCKALEVGQELAELAHDAKQFVEAFASNPVSQSTPHIYVSMLAFWPRSAPISKHYARYTRGPVEAEGTALDRRQLAHLSTWSFERGIQTMAVSPGGLCLVIGIGHNVLVVDSTSGRVMLGPLEGHTQVVDLVAFFPSGDRIVSVSCSNSLSAPLSVTVVGWDTRTGNVVLSPLPLHGHTKYINCLCFSPDCSRIVTGSDDKTVCVWDTETGELLHQFDAQSRVGAVVFSPDGTQVAAGANNTLHRWDTRTREPTHALFTHTDRSHLVAFSPDQSCITSANWFSEVIYVWDSGNGELIRSMEGHTAGITCIGYSPDGRFIASGSNDRVVCVWDAQSGNMVLGPLAGHTGSIRSIIFSPNSSRIISACSGGLVCTWDAQQRSLTSDPTNTPTDRITCAKFSSDGARFVTGSEEGTICIRSADTGETALGPIKVHPSRISAVDFKHNHVVSGSLHGEICVRDALTGEIVLGALGVGPMEITAIAYSPDGKLIAAGSHSEVEVLNVQDGGRVLSPLIDLHGTISSVQFSPDGARIVAGSQGVLPRIVVWDVSDGRNIFGTLDGHRSWVNSVSYSPNGALIASGSHDTTIILWDAYTGKRALDPLTEHSRPVRSVSFSPDSTRLVSGSSDRTIRIWDVKTGEMMFELLHGHENDIRSVEYSPDGTRIMSCSDDKSVRIHDARSPEERARSHSESNVGDWTMDKDGWVVDDQSRLLVWVPGDIRKGLMWPRTQVRVGPSGDVRLKFDKSRMGESWAQSYTSEM